ncbi:MAG: cupin domain-containing protein [Vicinamibacterales bacterium]
MTLEIHKPERSEMLAGLARFSELTRCSTGLPDMGLPEGERTFLNVLGFEQPEGGYSPFGSEARARIRHIKTGFGLSFIAARPGKGVLMHAHDTVETFMCIKGSWRIDWEGAQGLESLVLEPLDFIACPVGVNRRFECVSPGPGESEALLLGIIQGESPRGVYSAESMQRMAEAGTLDLQ